MSVTNDVTVQLDDRIRLMSALLAASHWPDRSQAHRPHGTHPYARASRKQFAAFHDHEAVQILHGLVDRGVSLEAIFSFAARLSWPNLEPAKLPRWAPPHWPTLLRHFYEHADLDTWWAREASSWQRSLDECARVFERVNLRTFIEAYLGPVEGELIFMPNIGYPTELELALRLGGQLVCIAPPRLAWGDSPPWPFDEDPSHVYRAALTQYGRLILGPYLRRHEAQMADVMKAPLPVPDSFAARHPTWQEQFVMLFVSGMVAIFLEDHVSAAEASAYTLMERKAYGVAILPGVISVLRRYQKEQANARYATLADFLPMFAKQVRVATRIVSL